MTRSYRKNTLRTFKSTASRFAAVFAIVALGVGFLAGLNATPIDMKESMERYMDDGNFYDLRIVSTLGLTDEDVDALRQVEGVRQVQPGYSADLLVEVDGDTVVSRVHSLPAPENNTINQLNLVEGRLPEKHGECVIEASYTKKQSTYTVGTKLVVDKANEDLDTKLSTTEYTVVGIVHNANYFSFEREPASVGNGTVKLMFYIPQQDFAYEAYTEVYLTAEGALEQDSLGDAYQTNIDTVKANVEAIADARCEARYDGIIADARAERRNDRHELIVAVCSQGCTDMVMNAARAAGARGGTVLHGKGTGAKGAPKFYNITIAQEKEMILIVAATSQKAAIMQSILKKAGPDSKAGTILFSLPTTQVAGFALLDNQDET